MQDYTPQSLPSAPPLRSVAHTDSGRRRRENQDSYCVVERPEYCFYAIADGMGGISGGGVASGIAIAAVKSHIDKAGKLDEITLRAALQEANARVYAAGQANPAYKGMGTTFTALGFVDGELYLTNVGDSRAYRLRGENLARLTEDHTFGTVLQQTGITSSEKANENPMSHLLYRSIGPAADVEPDCWRSTDPPQPGDIYLVCTDGLYAHLKEYEIAQTLQTCPIEVVAKRLVAIANDRGGKDNVTVVVVKVREDKSDNGGSGQKTASSAAGSGLRSIFRLTSLLMLLLGLAGGFVLAYLTAPWLKSIPNSKLPRFMARIDPGYLPPPGMGDPRASLASFDVKELKQQDPHKALPSLQEKLAEVRSAVEVTTRKLSIWHKRREQFFRTNDIITLAAEVAVTSPPVKEALDAFRSSNWEYLREAEKLIYQPVDKGQEDQVLQLSELRDKKTTKLRNEMQQVIDREVARALYQIRQLSAQRDELQSAIESVNRRIGNNS